MRKPSNLEKASRAAQKFYYKINESIYRQDVALFSRMQLRHFLVKFYVALEGAQALILFVMAEQSVDI